MGGIRSLFLLLL